MNTSVINIPEETNTTSDSSAQEEIAKNSAECCASFDEAIANKHFPCLKRIRLDKKQLFDLSILPKIIDMDTGDSDEEQLNQFEFFRFAKENQAPWDSQLIMNQAFQKTNFYIIKYINQHGIKFKTSHLNKIAEKGNLRLIEFSIEHHTIPQKGIISVIKKPEFMENETLQKIFQLYTQKKFPLSPSIVIELTKKKYPFSNLDKEQLQALQFSQAAAMKLLNTFIKSYQPELTEYVLAVIKQYEEALQNQKLAQKIIQQSCLGEDSELLKLGLKMLDLAQLDENKKTQILRSAIGTISNEEFFSQIWNTCELSKLPQEKIQRILVQLFKTHENQKLVQLLTKYM